MRPLRLIGRKYDASLATASKNWPFPVVNCNDKPLIQCLVNGVAVNVQPEVVLYKIFKKLKRAASKTTKLEPRFVIAIPGTYTYAHKRVILKAAEDAKMVVEYLVNHTTAAAIMRIIQHPELLETSEKLIAIDLGAGSLTISAMNIVKGHLEVLSTVGESYLGGSDITDSVASEFFGLIPHRPLRSSSGEVMRLMANLCEEAKKKLGEHQSASVNLERPYNEYSITWDLIAGSNINLFHIISCLLKRCMKQANINNSEDTKITVLLHGGSSNIRNITEIVRKKIPHSTLVNSYCQSRRLVAGGAAHIAAYLLDRQSKLKRENCIIDELIPTLAVRCLNNVFSQIVSPRHSRLLSDVKTIARPKFVLTTKEPCKLRVEVFEQERTHGNTHVYVGMVEMFLPKCPDEASFEICVSLGIQQRQCHVYVHETATGTNTRIDILAYDFSAPEIPDLIPLKPKTFAPLPADASKDSVDPVHLVGESSRSTVEVPAVLPQEESSVRIPTSVTSEPGTSDTDRSDQTTRQGSLSTAQTWQAKVDAGNTATDNDDPLDQCSPLFSPVVDFGVTIPSSATSEPGTSDTDRSDQTTRQGSLSTVQTPQLNPEEQLAQTWQAKVDAGNTATDNDDPLDQCSPLFSPVVDFGVTIPSSIGPVPFEDLTSPTDTSDQLNTIGESSLNTIQIPQLMPQEQFGETSSDYFDELEAAPREAAGRQFSFTPVSEADVLAAFTSMTSNA
ncbi:hypothetical protein J6590_075397, partial [Homalodisca vitripennis]